MRDVSADLIEAIRGRQATAVTAGADDPLWDALAEIASSHQPMRIRPDAIPGTLATCSECTLRDATRVWPCRTFRLLAKGFGLRA